mmetsp:Transcript_14118/g.30628  ORF Transcript_14118/g.30628 Transcript_14118/m.30628 type:complete len:240 (+) Transcript_14118:907-1626(+)
MAFCLASAALSSSSLVGFLPLGPPCARPDSPTSIRGNANVSAAPLAFPPCCCCCCLDCCLPAAAPDSMSACFLFLSSACFLCCLACCSCCCCCCCFFLALSSRVFFFHSFAFCATSALSFCLRCCRTASIFFLSFSFNSSRETLPPDRFKDPNACLLTAWSSSPSDAEGPASSSSSSSLSLSSSDPSLSCPALPLSPCSLARCTSKVVLGASGSSLARLFCLYFSFSSCLAAIRAAFFM